MTKFERKYWNNCLFSNYLYQRFIDLQVNYFFLVVKISLWSGNLCSGSDVSLSVIKILQMEIMSVHALEEVPVSNIR